MQHHQGSTTSPSSSLARERIRRGWHAWLRTPPRHFGEVDRDREVSFLELFYDLVYVAVIGRAAHHLGADLSLQTVVAFATVFALVWFAWFNGSVWHELHGREDGTSRLYIFVQMFLIALLAVFAYRAVNVHPRQFTLVYTLLLAQLTWQWFVVQSQSRDEHYKPISNAYLGLMFVAMVGMIGSGFVTDRQRVVMWAGIAVLMLLASFGFISGGRTRDFSDSASGSLVERFGLFTIVVLGEVVLGMVNGLSEVEHLNLRLLVIGVICLVIGMGYWWSYFDILGRRIPRDSRWRMAAWLYVHLPITFGIAATGASLVTLIEHANGERTPPINAWVLTGSASITVLGIAFAAQALRDDEFPPTFQRLILPVYSLVAAVMLVLGWVRPTVFVLVTLVAATMFLAWLSLFTAYLAVGGKVRVMEDAEGFTIADEEPYS